MYFYVIIVVADNREGRIYMSWCLLSVMMNHMQSGHAHCLVSGYLLMATIYCCLKSIRVGYWLANISWWSPDTFTICNLHDLASAEKNCFHLVHFIHLQSLQQ